MVCSILLIFSKTETEHDSTWIPRSWLTSPLVHAHAVPAGVVDCLCGGTDNALEDGTRASLLQHAGWMSRCAAV